MRNVRRLRRLKKISLATGSTREYFYQDTNSSHAYVADKNKHLRKTLDKKSGAAVICSFEYELDKAGNRLSVTDKDAKYTKYGIDGLYQLTNETKWSAKTPGTRTWQYNHKYDPNGNRTVMHHDGVENDFTYGDNNEMTAGPGVSPTYDNFGNTTAYDTATLTYDFERHMTNYSGGMTIADVDDHEYDGNGRRMRSKVLSAANWTNFVHDEITEQIIAEYTLVSTTFTITSVGTHGIGLISTNRSNVQRYFHFDGLGSTAALTDKTETVQDTYFYSAYGTLESSTGSSVNPYRFVGQWGYYDDTTHGSLSGFILLGIRYYKPDWGRFLVWNLEGLPEYSGPSRGGTLGRVVRQRPSTQEVQKEQIEPFPIVVYDQRDGGGPCPLETFLDCLLRCIEFGYGKAVCRQIVEGRDACFCISTSNDPCNPAAAAKCKDICKPLPVALCLGSVKDAYGHWIPKVCICGKK